MSQNGKVDRLKVKEMVEGWNGRKLPKNISLKTLIKMVVDEAQIISIEEIGKGVIEWIGKRK